MSERADNTQPTSEMPTTRETFNESQRLHLRVSCEYMDKMLQRVENVLRSQESASPFSRYQMDLSPAQGRVIEDYVRRLRSQILRTLAWQNIVPPPPQIPATRSIATDLHFIAIAISELRPYSMRGSGPMSETVAAELTGVVSELSGIVGQMMNFVKQEIGNSLQERIQKIANGDEASLLLQRVEHAVTKQGLVEFRPRINALLAGLEDPRYEVAVFGRVSSGKSSFLNALLQADLLPVGTNPITAVPTRIQHGATVGASVRYGNGNFVTVSVDEFRQLISEAGNPGNQKGVRHALLKSPSPRLAEGIVLVDTPGLGSLAIKGTRETLAYLPACDLALFLIDAGTTLTLEDIGTLRLIHEAGIPAIVLLSKADLLKENDRLESIKYIKSNVQDQLRISLPVYPISSVHEHVTLIDRVYEQDLQPRFLQSHALRLESLKTKLALLQADVVASLEARIEQTALTPALKGDEIQTLERLLMGAAGQLGSLARSIEDQIMHLGFNAPDLIDRVALDTALKMQEKRMTSVSFQEGTRDLQTIVEAEVSEVIKLLQETSLKAVRDVHHVGRALKRSSLPNENEVVSLVRDAPRFELPPMAGSIDLSYWRLMGHRAIKGRVLRALQSAIQPLLHKQLANYSAVLGAWSKTIIHDIQFSVESYADGYRTALQEMSPTSESTSDAAQIREDIAMLTAVS